jgi:hypothetical protein
MRIRHVVPFIVVVLVMTLGGPARADDDRGSCSGGPSQWRLDVGRESSTTLRLRFEIEGGDPDQEWQLFISDNDHRVYVGTKVSEDNGRLRVGKLTADRAGRDRIEAAGVNLDTGESCSASLTYR